MIGAVLRIGVATRSWDGNMTLLGRSMSEDAIPGEPGRAESGVDVPDRKSAKSSSVAGTQLSAKEVRWE